MKWVRWASFGLGLWLAAAPFVLGYGSVRPAFYQAVIFGGIIAGLAVWRVLSGVRPRAAKIDWGMATVGLWVILAPFVRGYSDTAEAMMNHVIIGLAVTVLSAWDALVWKRRQRAPV